MIYVFTPKILLLDKVLDRINNHITYDNYLPYEKYFGMLILETDDKK
jgi:hypothetical protein